MKNYRIALAALVLAFMFSTSVFADDGIMHTGIDAPAPPPPASVTQSLATDGVMWTGVAEPAPVTADTATVVALGLLQSMLSLV